MSSGLQMRADDGTYEVGIVPKAGWAGGAGGNVLEGCTDGFPGA